NEVCMSATWAPDVVDSTRSAKSPASENGDRRDTRGVHLRIAAPSHRASRADAPPRKNAELPHMFSTTASRGARATARLSILLLVAVSACEVPTKLPSWDQTWLIPGDSTKVSVSELLPKTGELTVSTSG